MHELNRLLKQFFHIIFLVKPSIIQINILAFCYITITTFDLLSLGIVFVVVNDFLGVSDPLTPSFVQNNASQSTLLLILPLVWLAKFFLVLLANFAVVNFSQLTILNIRKVLVKSLFSSRNPSNEQAKRELWLDTLNRQLSFASTGIIEPTLRALFDMILLIILCAFISIIAPVPFLTTLLWIGIGMVLYDKVIRSSIQLNSYEFNKESEKLTSHLIKVSEGFKEFWALRSSEFHSLRIINSARNMSRRYSRFAVLNMSPRLFCEFLIVAGVVSSIWISNHLNLTKEQTLVSLSVIGFGALRIIPLLNSVTLGINQLRSGGRTLENTQTLLDTGIETSFQKNVDRINTITLSGVNKSLGAASILRDINLTLKPKQPIVILGRSGSGKTTLIEIIAGLTTPDTGNCEAALVSGSTVPMNQLNTKIGYVTQKPVMVEGSILENITLTFDIKITHHKERLNKALLFSGFGKVMADNGIDLKTIIGPNKQGFSVGQEQKLAICRAIFLSQGLLVFDEPTSAFDRKSEEEFFESLSDLARDNIVIVATHSQKFKHQFSTVIDL